MGEFLWLMMLSFCQNGDNYIFSRHQNEDFIGHPVAHTHHRKGKATESAKKHSFETNWPHIKMRLMARKTIIAPLGN
jgi:hypothetical protein